MAKDISISICVPAFNEEKSLRESVEDLLRILSPHMQRLEIIIVNDGSSDSTRLLANQLAKEHPQIIKLIHHHKNLGIGACYRDALALARGDYYTWFPADHENSAEEFIRCLPYLRKDTIITCHHQGQDSRSFMRRRASNIYTYILNKCFHLDLKYYNGLTIFPTSVLRSILLVANGFLFSAESIIRTIQYGCQVIELSAPLRKRKWGKSKAFTFSSLAQIVRDFLCILLNKR